MIRQVVIVALLCIVSVEMCSDNASNCANWKKNGFCKIDFYDDATRIKYCQSTCDLCNATTASSGATAATSAATTAGSGGSATDGSATESTEESASDATTSA